MEYVSNYVTRRPKRSKNQRDHNPAPELTFASAAGFTFPKAKNAPPSITILFTLLAKEESLLIA